MNRSRSPIVLTTDFGHSYYVGQLKGVLSSLAPEVPVIDLTHEIEAQNILQGAVILHDSFTYFPSGSIHIVVVDPGVGTRRSLVAIQVSGQWLIGPDNGVFSGVIRKEKPEVIYRLTNPALWRQHVSTTFHGRDIMAPVAAFIANGGSPTEVGERIPQLEVDIWPIATLSPSSQDAANTVVGRVLFADRYGNLLTNVQAQVLRDRIHLTAGTTLPLKHCSVEVLDAGSQVVTVIPLVSTYGEAKRGELVAVIGSSDRMEISVVDGSAAQRLNFNGQAPHLIRLLASTEELS